MESEQTPLVAARGGPRLFPKARKPAAYRWLATSIAIGSVLVISAWYHHAPTPPRETAPVSDSKMVARSFLSTSPSLASIASQFDQCSFTENQIIKDAVETLSKRGTKLELSARHKHLVRLDGEIGSLPAANLNGLKLNETWSHCLPMSTRACNIGTMEMIVRDSPLPPPDSVVAAQSNNANFSAAPAGSSTQAPLCKASVLHLLLEEMWTVMRAVGCDAVPSWGSLLGAVRDQSIIPHTPDVDYTYFPGCSIDKLQDALWERGHLLITHGMHSWCIAAHHPLAPYMYDPNKATVGGPRIHNVPYGDLYSAKLSHITDKSGMINDSMVYPLQCERIINNEYPVFHRAKAWLVERYGENYTVPHFDTLRVEKLDRKRISGA